MLPRLYPLTAGAGLLVAPVAIAAGPVSAPAEALELTIGRFAALPGGGAVTFGMLLVGLSCLALAAGLRAVAAPVAGWSLRLLVAGGVAVPAAAALPAGVPADMVTVLALTGLAGAIALLARRFGEDEHRRASARPLEWLALGAGGGLAVLTYMSLPGHGAMIGLVEWSVLAIEVAALAVIAVLVWRAAPATSWSAWRGVFAWRAVFLRR
ncbi:DUF998 domain-containing protein, partial [Sphaerisporangium rufum]|uniref:DUF998 domain-containing protein n=1 Tax=Sphaerisporangium rufum TaxID=1381558 RepID=UPI001950D231